MIAAALQALFVLAFPALAIFLAQRVKFFSWIGPVVTCYAAGILLANLPFVPIDAKVSNTLTEAAVPLAIPLLLFSADFVKWARLARATVLSFALAVLAAMSVAYLAGRAFEGRTDESWKVAGMLVGVYTGGTPNMSAIGLALEVRSETFIMLNASDVILGGSYFFFLITAAHRVALLFLPPFKSTAAPAPSSADAPQADPPSFWSRMRPGQAALGFLLSALIVGASAGGALAIYGALNITAVMLGLTTLGIAASFVPRVRRLEGAYEVGEYLLLVFCVAIGTLADVRQVLTSSPVLFAFVAAVMLGAIVVHFTLVAIFRIDADTAIITNVAAIYGPAFIGPVAAALKNREIVVSGLTTGVVGYAVGNYAGLAIAYLLRP